MVKVFKSKKNSKKLKTLKNITLSPMKKIKKKLKHFKLSSKNNFKKISSTDTKQNDEAIKIFFNAQSTRQKFSKRFKFQCIMYKLLFIKNKVQPKRKSKLYNKRNDIKCV